jgi:HK97 family phage major capsid protein
MNKKTLATVAGIVTKYGQPLNLVQWVGKRPYILGIPVMDNIGNGKNPVVLGDLSYWATRLVADPLSGIQLINEAPGLVENGKVGLACFFRADGELLYNDTGSPAPFVMIQNHS